MEPSKASKTETQHSAWLDDVLPDHQRLAPVVLSLLESMLQKENIEYLNVSYRVKKRDEALKKINRKQYQKPIQQLTDLTGIRVVTFLEAQVISTNALIRKLFDVDNDNSLDRADALGLDKLGYRSTHFVCSLGNQRASLPEYHQLGALKFEIQVRTVLQHAWAELAHDRSFKFAVALPPKIERKLNLYSGMLEIVDNAFEDISKEIDEYKESLENKSITQISDATIDSISLSRFLEEIKPALHSPLDNELTDVISDELRHFGVITIGELKKLATDSFVDRYNEHITDSYGTGFLRLLIMHDDLVKYFQTAKPNWAELPIQPYNFLASKYGDKEVQKILDRFGKRLEVADENSNSQET